MFVCEKFPRAAKNWYSASRGPHLLCLCVYRLCGLSLALVQGNAHLMSLALRSPSFLFTQTTNDLSPLLKGGMTRKLRDGFRNEKGKTESHLKGSVLEEIVLAAPFRSQMRIQESTWIQLQAVFDGDFVSEWS